MNKREKKFCDLYIKTRDFIQTKLKLGYEININKRKFREHIQSKPIKKFKMSDDPIIRRLYAIAP